MNKLILEQLSKVKIADISRYDDLRGCYIIPKYCEFKYEVGKCYLIELDSNLLIHNSESILESNWNGGNIPKYKNMKVEVSTILNKMIKVTGIGYDKLSNKDIDDIWTGWLPIEQISVLEVYN